MMKSDLEVINSIRDKTGAKKHISTELDTDQGEGITWKLYFAAKQLNDKIQLHAPGASDECS